MQPVVLVVDDEPAIRDLLVFALKRAQMEPLTAADAEAALTLIADHRPDIMLLDWMMPGTSGLELARRLRRDEATKDIPIIMLTARTTEDDRVHGLDSGVDDYVTKPFSPRELVARVRAVLRRTSPLDDEGKIEFDGLVMDSNSRQVLANNKPVHMGPTEYRLLEFFMTHSGKAYSRSQLLDNVWGANVYVEERTVDVHIRRLRKALEPYKMDHYVQTVRGHGYRFSAASS
ncbi:MAG: phosphate regulon transcriptional regulator PhoB [Wenzhouxiangellaceae bacterium]